MNELIYHPDYCYTLQHVSVLSDVEPYVLHYWAKEGMIALYRGQAGRYFCLQGELKKILFVKKCLREDRLPFTETRALAMKWSGQDETQNKTESRA